MPQSVFDHLDRRLAGNIVPSTYTPPAQVFVSYAHEDKSRVQQIVQALEKRRLTVFWDRDIRAGGAWRQMLVSKLEQADCVLVIWSANALKSEWVMEEAAFGLARQVLVSARVEPCELPLGFKRLQTEDISGLGKSLATLGISKLITRIDELVHAWTSADGNSIPGSDNQSLSKVLDGTYMSFGLRKRNASHSKSTRRRSACSSFSPGSFQTTF